MLNNVRMMWHTLHENMLHDLRTHLLSSSLVIQVINHSEGSSSKTFKRLTSKSSEVFCFKMCWLKKKKKPPPCKTTYLKRWGSSRYPLRPLPLATQVVFLSIHSSCNEGTSHDSIQIPRTILIPINLKAAYALMNEKGKCLSRFSPLPSLGRRVRVISLSMTSSIMWTIFTSSCKRDTRIKGL